MICPNCSNQCEVLIDSLCPNCKRIQSINNDSLEKWIVFWQSNVRIGSVELNDSNWQSINKTFIYNTIQTDITGTVHIDLLGIIN
jgi:hypothetical protein